MSSQNLNDEFRLFEESVKRIMRGDVSALSQYCSSAYSILKMNHGDEKYSKMTFQERLKCIFFIISNIEETILTCDPKYRDTLILGCGFGMGKNILYYSCFSLLLAEHIPIKVKEWTPKWISILWLFILVLQGIGWNVIWMYESFLSFLFYSILIGSSFTSFKKFSIASFLLISSLSSETFSKFNVSVCLFLIFAFYSVTDSIRSRKQTLNRFHTLDTHHTTTVLNLISNDESIQMIPIEDH